MISLYLYSSIAKWFNLKSQTNEIGQTLWQRKVNQLKLFVLHWETLNWARISKIKLINLKLGVYICFVFFFCCFFCTAFLNFGWSVACHTAVKASHTTVKASHTHTHIHTYTRAYLMTLRHSSHNSLAAADVLTKVQCKYAELVNKTKITAKAITKSNQSMCNNKSQQNVRQIVYNSACLRTKRKESPLCHKICLVRASVDNGCQKSFNCNKLPFKTKVDNFKESQENCFLAFLQPLDAPTILFVCCFCLANTTMATVKWCR